MQGQASLVQPLACIGIDFFTFLGDKLSRQVQLVAQKGREIDANASGCMQFGFGTDTSA